MDQSASHFSGVLPESKRKGTLQEHIHVFGGEERFWMGPEGGQYALFSNLV